MNPIDKKLKKEVKEGKIPKPIEDLPSYTARRNPSAARPRLSTSPR